MLTGGQINRIRCFPEKGSSGVDMEEGLLVEGLGLKGDIHSKVGKRQLSLLLEGLVPDAANRGLCHSRFKENINLSFSEPEAIPPGTRLGAGEAIVEISGETKHCYKECRLYDAGNPCSLAGVGVFAHVVKGGLIHIGDQVRVILT